MELENSIRERRSIRKFLDRPVEESTLRDILDLARWSPSWANTQGWRLFVVTGEPLASIKRGLQEKADAKSERRLDVAPPHPTWPGEMLDRIQRLREIRSAIGSPLGMGANDLFGAPCLVLVAFDERLQPEYACFDAGLLTQTLCLAAHAKGVGSCIMAMAVGYPDVLRHAVPEAKGYRFVIGVALGHPNLESPVNRFERERASLEETTAWVS